MANPTYTPRSIFQTKPLTPGTRGILDPVRSKQLDAARYGGVVNGQPQPFNPNPTRPVVAPAVAAVTPAPQNILQPVQQPSLNDVDPASIQGQNTLANAGIYMSGSFGAQNARANGTGQPYRPPQQTERANPLSGDNNIPMESTSTRVAAPFVQRGRTTPAGQDVSPKPLPVATPTDDVGNAMKGTQDAIKTGATFTGGTGKFARSFGNAQSASAYHNFVSQLFPDTENA